MMDGITVLNVTSQEAKEFGYDVGRSGYVPGWPVYYGKIS